MEKNSWSFETDDKAMNIQLKFDGFSSAMGFMMQIAIIADKMNHHPEWSTFMYGENKTDYACRWYYRT